jgi:fermentation-respiration switch protein FrsA (DUF1100 family)
MHKKKRHYKVLLIICGILMLLYILVCNTLIDVTLVPEKMEQTQAFEDITEESIQALVHTDDIKQNEIKAQSKTDNWLKTVESKKLKTTTHDGYTLYSQTFLQSKTSHKWVILLHGYTGWKEALYPIAYEYHQRGYQILCPDMRASGESEGDFIGMGYTDRIDNQLWLDYIIKTDSEAAITIHGQSMGASSALMMSGEALPKQVTAIIADSAYTDVYTMFQKQIKDWFHLPAFPLVDGANLILQIRGGYNIKYASPLKAVQRSTIPTLFIHGQDDVFIPAEMSQKLYNAATCPKQLLIIEGAGHTQAEEKSPEVYYDAVFRFLEGD